MEEQELQEKVQDMEKELEELRPLKDSTAKTQEEFKQKEEAWLKEKQDLEANLNPNWSKARKKLEGYERILTDKGIKVDEEGNILNPSIDVDKIREESIKAGSEAARSELTGNALGKLLEQYEEGSRDVIKHYYDKLTQGEAVTVNSVDSFFNQAVSAASTSPDNKIKKALQFSGGQGPRVEQQGEIDPGRRQELGEALGFSFAKKSKDNK